MGRSESDWNKCKRHSKHKASSGVCPYCLRERLAHLASPSLSSLLTMACSSSGSSTPYYSSDSDLSSLAESPAREKIQKSRLNLLLRDEIQIGNEWPQRSLKSEPLLKSRSLIQVVARKNDSDEEKKMDKGKEIVMEKKEKKGKFWSKFLKGGLSLKKDQGEKIGKSLGYSRTLKEKPSAKWVPF